MGRHFLGVKLSNGLANLKLLVIRGIVRMQQLAWDD